MFIQPDERFSHSYILGRTGQGKTTVLENMILQDLESDHGVAYIDPHGQSAEKILQHIPKHRIKDTIYFNPSDPDNISSLNLLYGNREIDRTIDRVMVVESTLSALKHIWRDSWGPRLEYILAAILHSIYIAGNGTLIGAHRIMSDADFRESVVAQLSHEPDLLAFWGDRFKTYSSARSDALSAVENKLGRLAMNPVLAGVLGQHKPTIDVDAIMRDRKILIVNLGKGSLGEETADLLGSLLVAAFQMASMRRFHLDNEPPPYFLYVDEFQNFGTDVFASILSEARKFKLGLTLAHQYIEQIGDDVRDSIFGNVGTFVCLPVGMTNIRSVANALQMDERGVRELSKYQAWFAQAGTTPIPCNTLPPIQGGRPRTARSVRNYSRDHYTRPAAKVRSHLQRKTPRTATG